MIIADVDWAVISQTRTTGTRLFYVEKPGRYEIYAAMPSMLLRFVKNVTDSDDDRMWVSNNLNNATRVYSISEAGDDEWRVAFTTLAKMVLDIRDALNRKEGG